MTQTLANSSPLSRQELSAQKLTSLLMDAAALGDIDTAKKRIAQGADPASACHLTGETPLFVAVSSGRLDMVNFLLPLSNPAAVSFSGRSALSALISRFSRHYAPGGAAAEWIDLVYALAPASASTPDRDGRSPFMEAASAGHASDLQFILRIISTLSPHVDWNALDHNGMTACAFAAQSRNPHLALAIFNATPDKELACRSTFGPRGSLAHIAVTHGCGTDFLSRILPFSDVDARDSLGRTPLMLAVSHGADEFTEILLPLGLGARAVDFEGRDALMLLIEDVMPPMRGRRPSFIFQASLGPLISDLIARSDLLARDFLGESALDKARNLHQLPHFETEIRAILGEAANLSPPMLKFLAEPTIALQRRLLRAAAQGDIQLVRKRIAQGADPRLPASSAGSSALMAAISQGHMDVIHELLPMSNLQLSNDSGDTALTRALLAFRSHHLSLQNLLDLLPSLATPEAALAQSSSGATPLMLVASMCVDYPLQEKIVALLGALSDWRSVDNHGRSVVAVAVAAGSDGLALALWCAHPDAPWLASIVDSCGATLAHIAAASGNVQILDAIAPLSDFSARDANGFTPLMLACSRVDNKVLGAIARISPWSDCHAVNRHGCDPLMIAIESCDPDPDLQLELHLLCIAEILAPRVDIFARDHLGESALDKANDRGFAAASKIISAQMAILDEREALSQAAPLSIGALQAKRI